MSRQQAAEDSRDRILETAQQVGREVLAHNAVALDAGTISAHPNFTALAETGLLGLTVPRQFGGLDASPLVVLEVNEILARFCGVTAFLLTQHVGECSRIGGAKYPLSERVLPKMATGEYIVGVGASQLRRSGQPLLRGERVDGGYILTGSVPWASGYGLMTHLSLGAVIDGIGPLFFWVPFKAASGFQPGTPMDITVMHASATVSLTCESFFVADSTVVGDDRSGAWTVRHGGALSSPVAFLLGVGTACLDQLTQRVSRSESAQQVAHIEQEAQRLETTRTSFYTLYRTFLTDRLDQDVLDALLNIRVSISRQVLHLAGLAVAAEGGTAHLRSNPAQRHLREAAFFCTVTVNPSAREALILGL